MKRSLALILALGIVFGSLTACSSTPSSDDTQPPAVTTSAPETEPPVADLELIKNGVSNYRIIRGENANEKTIDAAVKLRTLFGDIVGISPDLGTDWVKRGTERDHEALEILVGMTDYEESMQALEGVPYGDYIITAVGNKLVINAWSELSLNSAITDFARELRSIKGEDGSIVLPADIRMSNTMIPIANQVPVYEGGQLSSVYHSGDSNQVLIFKDTTPDAYKDYRKALEDAGYTLYAENDIVDNHFATYINDEYVINAGYYAYETSARVIIEPRTTLPNLPADNVYTASVQPSISMLGLGTDSDHQNGMSFVFQLADGSYIIIDGGFSRSRDSKQLYDFMYQNAPDPKNITIAAWIITHTHGDHDGAYRNFTETYAPRVKLERLIANFPSDEARHLLGTEGGGGAKDMSYVARYADAEFVKVHAGQKFYLRDAEVEFLYTLESFAPGELTYFNTTSLVFKIKIAGQEFLFLGDASNDALTITSKMYGDYLDSDYVQTAHHGYTTGSSAYSGVTDTYSLASPTVVLWPVGDSSYSTMYQRAYDAHLQNLESVKEIFVAGIRDITLPLPYTAQTSKYESIFK